MVYIEISDDYKWVALVASLISLEYTITGFWAGGQRKKHFTQEYLTENFQAEHEKYFPGTKVSKEAYPDMGNGRYSEKLPYKSWFEFNNAQRVHYNFLESVTAVLTWLLIAGLKYEWVAVALGSAYFVARLIYAIGYASRGPTGRLIGFLMFFLSQTALCVFAILSPLRLAGVY